MEASFFMRRSICTTEPRVAFAGDIGEWKFIYTTAINLAKGARIKFDLGGEGRAIDWEIPTAEKKTENVIWAHTEDGNPIYAKEIERPDSYVPEYEFTLPHEVKAGKTITIVIGLPKGKKATKAAPQGNQAQTFVQRRRPFQLFIDPKGKGQYGEPEIFSMDVRGNILAQVKILSPSFVSKNKRFDVTIRFEDAFGNLTSTSDEDTLIELSHEGFRENLSWKLFLPETGYITLPNLYFNEDGIYTIELRNLKTKENFHSAPIRCYSDLTNNLYWGTLHGESDRVDSTVNIESCLRHMRDDLSYNFFAASPFEASEETDNDTWKHINNYITEFNDPDRFICFSGFQYVGKPKDEGVRLFIFNKDNKQLLRQKDQRYSTLKKIYQQSNAKEMISIPTFTAAKGFEYNFKLWDENFERIAEIYNAWGCSEKTKKEGNPCPIEGPGKKGIQESAEGTIINALMNNCRVGFIAGGLDDREIYAPLFENEQTQYPPGLTAIVAKERTRDALFEALYNRSCYATTGERMLLEFTLAGLPMGSEISTEKKPGLTVNRHIAGFAAGTQPLETVELIRNGKVLTTFKINEGDYKLNFEYDDMTPLEKNVIKIKDAQFAFYYLRITQADGHMAWSSPIWVDLGATPAAKAKK